MHFASDGVNTTMYTNSLGLPRFGSLQYHAVIIMLAGLLSGDPVGYPLRRQSTSPLSAPAPVASMNGDVDLQMVTVVASRPEKTSKRGIQPQQIGT